MTKTGNAGGRGARLHSARERLGSKPHRRPQQPFDPENLPTRGLTPDPGNQPRTDPADFHRSGLFDTPYARLAALGDFRLDGLPGAEDPAFLAESDEVVLTPVIRAKAAELGHDPVRIYHWVRNTIDWQPGWGAAQDAELTLGAGRGNAMDIASLLIALLRASGIPARYVHGTVEIPEDRFRNWAGGFADIAAAADYAASSGMPITTLVAAGRIAAVRLGREKGRKKRPGSIHFCSAHRFLLGPGPLSPLIPLIPRPLFPLLIPLIPHGISALGRRGFPQASLGPRPGQRA
jgi:hypothetical protein